MSISLELLIIAGLILANGFFAAAEVAVLTARRNRLEQQARSQNRRHKRLGSGVQSGEIPAGGSGGYDVDRDAGFGLWRATLAGRRATGWQPPSSRCLPRITRLLRC